jgi:pimeloyl-ACP methyl ester carboxylesterase
VAPTSGYDKRTMARDIHRLLHDHLRVREPAIIAGDVAELLVAGRERQYIQYFSNARIFDPGAISAADLDVYVTAYSAPGAMRGAFEVYRAFGQDADDNRRLLREKGRLNIPVLALGGTISTTGAVIEEMTKEVAEDVTAARIAGAGHWIAEENPQAVVAEVLGFVAG